MDNKELHSKILYPVTRVRSAKAGGSGVIVYSKEDEKNPGEWLSFILTCEHVIDDSIKIKDDWDPVLKRQTKKDFFEEVAVEVFDYTGSRLISSNSTQADIIAYDKHHDLAVLKLHNPKPLPYAASIIPKEDIKKLKLFDPVWVSGASLLHDPFASPGNLTYLREIIEQKSYVMVNAPSVFGNSGGGLFHGEHGYLLGLTSRITSIQLGFGFDVMTWMGFSTHPERLYEFLEHNELQFIYDSNETYYSGEERRKKKRKQSLRSLIMEDMKETSVEEDNGLYVSSED